MDNRLESVKEFPRAMQSYTLTLYEMVYELRPNKMLEIGVQRGQSSRAILLAMKDGDFGTLVSVDHKDRSTLLDGEYEDVKSRWKFVQGDSTAEETIQAVKDTLDEGEKFGMLFVDGGHKMPVVQLDWDNYTPLVQEGGIILLHDIFNVNEEVNQMYNNIPKDWEKFGFWWGRARNGVIPGFGLVRKPLT